MAERWFNQFSYSLEKRPVNLYASFLGGGTNTDAVLETVAKDGTTTAPSGTSYHGVTSLKKTGSSGDGAFILKFQDVYDHLLDLNCAFFSVDNSTAPATRAFWIKAINCVASGGATVTVVFTDLATPSGADLDTNTVVYIKATFANSKAV